MDKISGKILETLKAKELLVFKVDESTVLSRIQETFLKDIQAEDDLDREVENILKSHTSEIDSGQVDYRRMFNLIKSKLVRERGMVI